MVICRWSDGRVNSALPDFRAGIQTPPVFTLSLHGLSVGSALSRRAKVVAEQVLTIRQGGHGLHHAERRSASHTGDTICKATDASAGQVVGEKGDSGQARRIADGPRLCTLATGRQSLLRGFSSLLQANSFCFCRRINRLRGQLRHVSHVRVDL